MFTKLIAFTLTGACLAVAGCAVDATPSDENIASSEEELACYNPEGVNSLLAALAVAMGTELKRWQPSTDLVKSGDLIVLTSTGKNQCSDKKCWNTQAILDLQNWSAHQKIVFPGGGKLDVGSYRSRLQTLLYRQNTCDSRPDNKKDDNCPAEAHKLTISHSSPGACDQDFWFEAKAPNGSKLKAPSQLKNKLLFAGYPDNPFLGFQCSGDMVAIDPTYGTNQSGSTSGGACTAACQKMSSSNIQGACCSCDGVGGKKFYKSAWSSSTYLCL